MNPRKNSCAINDFSLLVSFSPSRVAPQRGEVEQLEVTYCASRKLISVPTKMKRYIRQVFLSTWFMVLASARFKIPTFSGKKKYTPLIFFTVPKDIIPECDAMEKIVSEVERELGVHVERLDIARDSAAEAAMATLTQRQPPFLYHRESCQVVSVPASSDKKMASPIDKDRVRAWAKGRIITSQSTSSIAKSKAPVVVTQEDNSIDQKDLIEDATLSPMQQSGKEKMKERTKELGKSKK